MVLLWKENVNLYSAFCWCVRKKAKIVRSHLLGSYILILEEEANLRVASLFLKTVYGSQLIRTRERKLLKKKKELSYYCTFDCTITVVPGQQSQSKRSSCEGFLFQAQHKPAVC